MQQTEKYNFNLIETSDPFSPEALNKNAQQFEAQLARVDGEAIRIVTGTYDGDGNNYQDIDLGFKSKALLVFRDNGSTCTGAYPYGGLALPDAPVGYNSTTPAVEITDTGFRVHHSNTGYIRANESGRKYYYMAFR